MNNEFAQRAASRARWLAELCVALDEAQALLSQLVAERIDRADADRLHAHIEELRSELRSFHLRGFASGQIVEAPLRPDWQPRRD